MSNNSTTTFSNDGAWKAFKYSVLFIWWCIKAMFKVIGFLFIGYKKYKEYKARKAAERAAEAAAAAAQEQIAAAPAAAPEQATAPTEDAASAKPE